ncbi:MAG: Mur ligase domain-containing protein [Desulfobacterales bacterium]
MSDVTQRLESLGAPFFTATVPTISRTWMGRVTLSGHPAIRIPEVTAALESSVPVIPRAEMLAELMRLKDMTLLPAPMERHPPRL